MPAIVLLSIFMLGIPQNSLQETKEYLAYTPTRGSEERKAILDALRKELSPLHSNRVLFVVNYLKVCDGWAWVYAQPQSADGENHYEDALALLHIVEDSWLVVEIPCTEEDNPDCICSDRYYEGLLKRYPEIPEKIFPIN